MRNVALALALLTCSTVLFACSDPAADDTGSSEAAYSFTDPPRGVELDAASLHVECTNTHGSFVVLTFEDRIFTAHGTEDLATCTGLREDLAARTAPLHANLIEEHGAINRGTLNLDVGAWSLESWGN